MPRDMPGASEAVGHPRPRHHRADTLSSRCPLHHVQDLLLARDWVEVLFPSTHPRNHGSAILPQAEVGWGWGWAEAARSQVERNSPMFIKLCILLSKNSSSTLCGRGMVTAEYSIDDTGFRDHWKVESAAEHSCPGLCDTQQVTKPLWAHASPV